MPAVIIPALIAAGGSVAGAEVESNAVGNAQNAQLGANQNAQAQNAQSTQQALGLLAGQQGRNQQNLSPYMTLGTNALQRLGVSPSAIPPQSQPINPQTLQAFGPQVPQNVGLAPFQAPSPFPGGQPIQTGPAPGPGVTAQSPGVTVNPGGALTLSPSALAAAQGQPQPTTGLPTVLMQSPDGKEQQRVPANQVSYWQSKGAKVIG